MQVLLKKSLVLKPPKNMFLGDSRRFPGGDREKNRISD